MLLIHRKEEGPVIPGLPPFYVIMFNSMKIMGLLLIKVAQYIAIFIY